MSVDTGNPDSPWNKAKSTVEAAGAAAASGLAVGLAATTGAFAAIGGPAVIAACAAIGSSVPVVGTVVGAVVGTIIALFEVFKKNPNPGIDDAYWDTLGREGDPGHEPNGLDISTAQVALVQRFAGGIAAQPNWQARWPQFWNGLAHSANPHSSLLADAVARMLGAPQGGLPMAPPVAPVRVPVPVPLPRFVPGQTITRITGGDTLGAGYVSSIFAPKGSTPAPAPVAAPAPTTALQLAAASGAGSYDAAMAHLAALNAAAAKPALSSGAKVAIGAGLAGAGVAAAHLAGYPVLTWASSALAGLLHRKR